MKRKMNICLGILIIILIWFSALSTNLLAVRPGVCYICIVIDPYSKNCQLNEPDSGWTKCGQYSQNNCYTYGVGCSLY